MASPLPAQATRPVAPEVGGADEVVEVHDIEAVADLEAKGVTVVNYTERPLASTGHISQLGPACAAWFTDPDGRTSAYGRANERHFALDPCVAVRRMH